MIWLIGCVAEVPLSQWDPAHDWDGDGLSELDGDCDDGDAGVGAGAPHWIDADGDGFGDGDPASACALPSGAALAGGDCDDARPDVFPGAVDQCGDGVDADCVAGDPPCALVGVLSESDAAWAHIDADEIQGAALATFPAALIPGARGAVVGIGVEWRSPCPGCDEEDGGEEAWLYASTAEGDVVRRVTFASPGLRTRLHPIGDVDGDGQPDLLAASGCHPDEGDCPSDANVVWLVPGPITGDRAAEVPALVGTPGEGLGIGAAALGSAGYAVAAEGGAVYLVGGSDPVFTWEPIASLVGPDLDGDGEYEIVVGAADAVRVAWFAPVGGGPVEDAALAILSAPSALGDFGTQVATGDLDGDGRDDLLVGGGERVWLMCGGLADGALDDGATGTVEGPPSFGSALTVAQDLDAALLVGAPDSNSAWLYDRGCAGATAHDQEVRATFASADGGLGLGFAVLGPGDVDGDGWGDVVIGAERPPRPDDDGASAFLFLGP